MKLFKRLFAMLLIATMAISMVACGNKESGGSSTPTTAPVEDNKGGDSSADEPVLINAYRPVFNLTTSDTAEVEKIETAINDYLAEIKANVRINLTETGSGEYKDKAPLALKNNEINLFWTASWQEAVGCDIMVTDNSAYDITDLLKGTKLEASMDQWIWDASAYDGKNYFVPIFKDMVEGYAVMFRQDLIDKYGWDITTVKSIKDIEPMLEDLMAEGIKYPYLAQKTAMFYRYYLDEFDFFSTKSFLAVDRATDKICNPILSDSYKDFCSLMSSWVQKGYMSEDDATKLTTDTTTQTKDWGISWWTVVPFNDEADSRYGQDVTMAPVTNRWSHSTSTLGSCYAVTKNSTEEQAKACIEFLGLLYTDRKLSDYWTYGIEGTDYDVVNGKIVKKGDMFNHSMWESVSATNVSLVEGDPDNFTDLYKVFNGDCKPSSAAGFRFDKKPIEAEFTACTAVFDEFGHILECGGIAPADVEATIKSYEEALMSAGYQKIFDEATSQYEAWKANK